LKFLSIIIPVFNNADVLKSNLPYLCDYLSKKDFDYEIILSDDGSKNGDVVEKISSEFNCKYIKSNMNYGKGNAIKSGMFAASGFYRIYTDADIPYGNDGIDDIIYNLDKEKFDVVIGDRTLNKSSYYKDVSFLRSVGSRFFAFVVGGVTSEKFADTQCGLKGFTFETATELFGKSHIKGFALDVELLFLASKLQYKIKKIPVKLRTQGTSTVKIIKHGFLMMLDLLKIKIMQVRKKYE
jgi:dolichyl-phosphate beta-glucosyltransferase